VEVDCKFAKVIFVSYYRFQCNGTFYVFTL
jgi:hypothetical protein